LFLTLTVNPAIDKTITADRLAFEDRSYILASSEAAGGRGVNASRVLHSYGVETLAILPSGGDPGKRLEGHLSAGGFPFQTVPVANPIRTNLIITDRQGLTVKLNEPGPELSLNELKALEETVVRHLDRARWLLLCGSLPPGAGSAIYVNLIRAATKAGVRTLVDSDAEVLQDVLQEAPAMVTPNLQETSRLLNKGIITRQHMKNAVARLLSMGAQSVVLSLGGRGAVAAQDGRYLEVIPPRVDAVCPIGAGDALNAAFVYAAQQGRGFTDAVRWGVAAGTATAMLPGLQFAGLDLTAKVMDQVAVRQF
jgi:1-phosphofructokinase family hexose kinase